MKAPLLFDVTVTRTRSEEHVLRLGEEPGAAEAAPDGGVRIEDYVGASVEEHLRVAVEAELAVRLFEKRKRRVLDLEPFSRLQRFVIRADQDRNASIEIPEDALESIPELTFEELEALDEKALDEILLTYPKLEFVPALTRKEWKRLDFLTEIIATVPNALMCWRVQAALGTLRELHVLFPGGALPRELRALLRRIGDAVSTPPKQRDLAEVGRHMAILTAWRERSSLSREQRENLAASLGFGNQPGGAWASLSRLARKYRKKYRNRIDWTGSTES